MGFPEEVIDQALREPEVHTAEQALNIIERI
jgi:hypothetical protein